MAALLFLYLVGAVALGLSVLFVTLCAPASERADVAVMGAFFIMVWPVVAVALLSDWIMDRLYRLAKGLKPR